MKIKFTKVSPEAVTPKKARDGDAAFDMVAISVEENRKLGIVTYGTGIALEIPRGYVGLLFPRSSVYKEQLSLANCVGIIDSGYRGEILFKYRIVQPHIHRYTTGDRVGQLLVMPYPDVELKEVAFLSASERGTKGFGSSGR